MAAADGSLTLRSMLMDFFTLFLYGGRELETISILAELYICLILGGRAGAQLCPAEREWQPVDWNRILVEHGSTSFI